MFKTMNSKMTTNSQLSITEPKKQNLKLRKQLEQEPITEMEITWKVISEEGEAENGGKRHRD